MVDTMALTVSLTTRAGSGWPNSRKKIFSPKCSKVRPADLVRLEVAAIRSGRRSVRHYLRTCSGAGHAQSTAESGLEKSGKVAKLDRWIPHQIQWWETFLST
ncbi:unnamed protein product [Haemonchus placei]|uniref:Uncharacterized protein n=1 Tax=Haemonchus placei TaxID=6290 RepID=A0A0N4W0K0_HAEPC|nr:unnamed protein product [Haemonchus placei]